MADFKVAVPKEMDFSAPQTWPEWKRRFLRYRSASGLSERNAQRQVDMLLYCMGEEAESISAQLVVRPPRVADVPNNIAAEDADGTLFNRTVEALDNYFMPRDNHLHYAVLLGSRVQQADESNEQFIRNVHELAAKCGNWDQAHRNDMMRTRLLAGMRDKELSRELQLNVNITLEEIKQQMRTKEIIAKNQKAELDEPQSVQPVESQSVQPVQQTSYPYKSKSNTGQTGSQMITDCKFCGLDHARGRCPAYNRPCNQCYQKGHFKRRCPELQPGKRGGRPNTQRVTYVAADDHSDGSVEDGMFHVNTIDTSSHNGFLKANKWLLTVSIQGYKIETKVDTGAQVSTMSLSQFIKLGGKKVTRTSTRLTGYGNKEITVIGRVKLDVSLRNGKSAVVKFYVTDDDNQTLLGMPAIQDLQLLSNVKVIDDINESLSGEYDDVFTGLGKVGEPVSLQLKHDAKPRAVPPRVVPHRLKQKLKKELDKLVSQGVIVKDTSPTQWLCPLVLVHKPSGDLRLVLDPQYLNTQLVRAPCAIPTTTEIFSKLSGSKYFSTLDAKSSFHQIPLDDESSKLLSFVTPFGKFRYVRLGMGICNASEIFHQTMMDNFSDLPGVEIYIDDILVHAPTKQEHDSRLKMVLERCRKIGLTLNSDKTVICQELVSYLGHELNSDGIRPSHSKVEAIKNMVAPVDKPGVQRFLGFVNYLAKFIPNLSEHAKPLRDLCKERQFIWGDDQAKAFQSICSLIIDAPTLSFYSGGEVTLSTDASSHSIGATILEDGKPLEFAAKSMTDCQTRYSQIEKELLAILFVCERFKYYVIGQERVVVETDHLPLVGLMTKDINLLSPRLAAMRIKLLAYPIELQYKPGRLMVLADTLSRSCPDGTNKYDDLGIDPMKSVCSVVIRSESVMSKYQRATSDDEELQVVLGYVQKGWPSHKKSCGGRALAFWNIKNDLSEVDGLLFYGERLVIPTALRDDVLKQLHEAHQGVTKTLQKAMQSVFWPGLRRRIEDKCQSCDTCLRSERNETKEPLIPLPIPYTPFEMVGVDLFHLDGKDFLLLVDYLTKWPVVKQLARGTSSNTVIQSIKEIFADFGQSDVIVSDNGPQFSSGEFKRFCSDYNIRHQTSSPLHPSGNGQSERTIGTVKSMLSKCSREGSDWLKGLVTLRNTPVADGLPSPAELLQGRILRDSMPVSTERYKVTSYDLELVRAKLGDIKSSNKYYHDRHAGPDKVPLHPGQQVYFRAASGEWKPGKILRVEGDRSYEISGDFCNIRRNRKDIRICKVPGLGNSSCHVSPTGLATVSGPNADVEPPSGRLDPSVVTAPNNQTETQTVLHPGPANTPRQSITAPDATTPRSDSIPQPSGTPTPIMTPRRRKLPSRFNDHVLYSWAPRQ